MSHTALQRFLLFPAERTDLLGLCQAWRQVRITAACQRQGRSALDPGHAWLLPGKVRGAWGQALLRGASPQARAGQPCPWTPPCALEALFRPQGQAAGGLELARPYVLAVSPDGDGRGLTVRLSLFGAAGEYALAAAEALVIALGEGTFHLAEAPERLEVTDREVGELEGPDLSQASLAARLGFITPLCQRRGNEVGLEAPSLLTGLANRLSSLARWHGLELVADWRQIKEIAQGLQWDFQGPGRVTWRRKSQRQDGREIPMAGLLGDLYLRGDLLSLAPLLALGERCHAGGHTSLGLGRYELSWL